MNRSELPLVCICVPTYNSEKTLSDTLDSLLGQTYQNFILTIVDNASSDSTLKIADEYAVKDSRISVLKHSENIGAEGNYTRCLGLGRGEYTAVFHSDDIYTPTMVQEQVEYLEKHRQAGAVFVMAQDIDNQGNLGVVYHLPSELSRNSDALYGFDEIFRIVLKYGSIFFCPGVMARTSVYRDYICKWDIGDFRTAADVDVWLRIFLKGPAGFIDKPLLHYRGAASTSYSYRALRTNTAPQDILHVLDCYTKGQAASLMGKKEWGDYALQVLKDNINRGFKFLLAGDAQTCRELLHGLFVVANIRHAVKSVFHIKVIAYGYLVYILSWLPLCDNIRSILFKARFEWPNRLRCCFSSRKI